MGASFSLSNDIYKKQVMESERKTNLRCTVWPKIFNSYNSLSRRRYNLCSHTLLVLQFLINSSLFNVLIFFTKNTKSLTLFKNSVSKLFESEQRYYCDYSTIYSIWFFLSWVTEIYIYLIQCNIDDRWHVVMFGLANDSLKAIINIFFRYVWFSVLRQLISRVMLHQVFRLS